MRSRGWGELIADAAWAKRPEFANPVLREQHGWQIYERSAAWTAGRKEGEVYLAAQERKIACFPVNRMEDLLELEQLKHRGFWAQIDHPVMKRIAYPGIPARVSGPAPVPSKPAPEPGEHNAEIRRELGRSSEMAPTCCERPIVHTKADGVYQNVLGRVRVVEFQLGGGGPILHQAFGLDGRGGHQRVTATTLCAPLASIWTSTLRFGEMRDEIDQNQSPDYAHTRRHTLDWQNDLQLGKSDLLTVGAYGAREHIAALSYGSDYRDLTDTTAWFLQNQWKQAGHNLLLAWRRTRHDAFGSHDTGEASYGYQLTPAWLVYGSYATGFRAPDGSDRFGSGGNPNLLPETSRNAEFGTRLRLSASQLVTLNAFYNNIDDLISYVGPWPTGSMQNIDRARIRGVELAYRFQDGPWRFDAEGVTQDPENLETNRQLARRATESATLQASYTATHYTLGANVVAQGT